MTVGPPPLPLRGGGLFDGCSLPASRHARRRLERRVVAAQRLMEAGELPEEVDAAALAAAVKAMQERHQAAAAAAGRDGDREPVA
eukprot:1195312-Prorocentrum_minimum.AAC.1